MPWPLSPAQQGVNPSGLGGGVGAYRGNESEQFQNDLPNYVGHYQLGFMNEPGLETVYVGVAPAIGSTDLAFPRDTGSVPGTDRIIHSVGPVSGRNSNWTGLRNVNHTPAPGVTGPVVGGADYATQLAASQAAAISVAITEAQSSANLISGY